MSMFVTITDNDKSEFVCEFHKGKCQRKYFMGLIRTFVDAILFEVQADGDELEMVKKQFPNLPQSVGSRVVRWYGDDALFIIGNIDLT